MAFGCFWGVLAGPTGAPRGPVVASLWCSAALVGFPDLSGLKYSCVCIYIYIYMHIYIYICIHILVPNAKVVELLFLLFGPSGRAWGLLLVPRGSLWAVGAFLGSLCWSRAGFLGSLLEPFWGFWLLQNADGNHRKWLK